MGIALGFGGIMFADVDNDMETMGLDENVDIEGIVRSNTGTPLQYVKVSIVDKQLFTTTDARGKFILLDVPPGKQEIMVEKEGYTTIIHKAFITPSGSWLEQFRDYDPDAYEKEFEFELTPGEGTKRTGSFPQFALFSCILFACAMVAVVFSIVALIGAYFAFKRRKFAITMIGAILGIFSLGFFIGAILSIVALFLLILSSDEFKRRKQMDMQRMDMHRKDEKINR